MRRLQRSYDARNAKFGRAGEELQGGGEGGVFGRFQNMQFCHFVFDRISKIRNEKRFSLRALISYDAFDVRSSLYGLNIIFGVMRLAQHRPHDRFWALPKHAILPLCF